MDVNKLTTYLLIGICSAFLLIVLSFFIPQMYDFVYGEEVVQEHIAQVAGNATNHTELALAFMEWVDDEVPYPQLDQEIFVLAGGYGLYKINNRTRFFIRGGPASWVIKTKLGRCGEDARYFAEVMNRSGYRARVVKPEGWDHAWSEYFVDNITHITVDASSNRVIYDKYEWAAGKNVTSVIAYELDGSEEDVTAEYLKR